MAGSQAFSLGASGYKAEEDDTDNEEKEEDEDEEEEEEEEEEEGASCASAARGATTWPTQRPTLSPQVAAAGATRPAATAARQARETEPMAFGEKRARAGSGSQSSTTTRAPGIAAAAACRRSARDVW